jgi:hypothetical protein
MAPMKGEMTKLKMIRQGRSFAGFAIYIRSPERFRGQSAEAERDLPWSRRSPAKAASAVPEPMPLCPPKS